MTDPDYYSAVADVTNFMCCNFYHLELCKNNVFLAADNDYCMYVFFSFFLHNLPKSSELWE